MKDELMKLVNDSFDNMCKEVNKTRKELAIKLYLIKAVSSNMPIDEVIRRYYINEEPDRSLSDGYARYKTEGGYTLIDKENINEMTYGARMVILEREEPCMDKRICEDIKAEILNYLLKGIQV